MRRRCVAFVSFARREIAKRASNQRNDPTIPLDESHSRTVRPASSAFRVPRSTRIDDLATSGKSTSLGSRDWFQPGPTFARVHSSCARSLVDPSVESPRPFSPRCHIFHSHPPCESLKRRRQHPKRTLPDIRRDFSAETPPFVHGGRSLSERTLELDLSDVCARGGRELAISRPRCGPERVRALADAGVRSRRRTHGHFPASAREGCDHFRFPPEKSETGLSVSRTTPHGGRLATLGDGAVAHRACVTLLRAYNHPRITALDFTLPLPRAAPLVRLRSMARIFSSRALAQPPERSSTFRGAPCPLSGRHWGV